MPEQFVGAVTEESKQKALEHIHAQLLRDWQDVNRADLVYFLESAQSLALPPGKVIYTQGESVEVLYLLISGTVEELRLINPGGNGSGEGTEEFSMREVGANSWLGVYDLVYRNPHSTSARTRGVCEVVAIRAQDMHRLLHRFPVLRNHLLPVAKYARLRTIPMLSASDDVQVTFVADSVEIKEYKQNENIYAAGADADKVYLIDEGQVRLDHQDGTQQMWLGNGGEFGLGERLAAAPGDLYALDHSAVATTQTRVFVLSRRSFFVITGSNPEYVAQEQRRLRREALAAVEVFRDWDELDKVKLLGWMSHYFIPNNHLLTQQGEVVDSMWILLKGKPALVLALGAHGEAIPESRVKGPAYFSEDALKQQVAATSSLEAEAGSAWLRLHWQDYRKFVDRPGGRELTARLRMPASAGGEARIDPATSAPVTTSASAAARQRHEWLELGESITLETKRHWVVAMWMLTPAIFLSLVAGGFAYALIEFGAGWALWGENMSWWAWGWWISLLGAVFAWVWGAYDYLNDFLMITNMRVVRQEKVLLIRHMRQIAPLDKVQDVTISSGWWGNLLKYATVEVQTAGTSENIVFDRSANFDTVADAIKAGRDRRMGHYRAVGKREIYAALENRFGLTLKLPSRVVARAGVRETREVVEEGWLTGIQRRWRRARAANSPGNDERATITWHKHPIILIWRLILPVLCMVLALGALIWIWPSLWAGDAVMGMAGFLTLVAFGGSTFWVWYRLEDWSNDLYILDKDQLIDIARKPLAMNTERRTASLSQVVDIQVQVPSPIHYIFNFGTAIIQTAAVEGNFSFANVANPLRVAELIRMRMDRNQQAEQRLAARQRAEELPDWLEAYSRLDPNQEKAAG